MEHIFGYLLVSISFFFLGYKASSILQVPQTQQSLLGNLAVGLIGKVFGVRRETQKFLAEAQAADKRHLNHLEEGEKLLEESRQKKEKFIAEGAKHQWMSDHIASSASNPQNYVDVNTQPAKQILPNVEQKKLGGPISQLDKILQEEAHDDDVLRHF